MLKGVKKGEVNKSDYRFEEKGKGYYKVVDRTTTKYRIMSKDKVESIFGKIKKEEEEKEEKPVEINLEELINNIDIEKFKTNDLSIEEKKAIKDKCEELGNSEIKAYKDMILFIKENK